MEQINKQQTSALEAEIVRLINQALKEKLIELGIEDMKLIAKEIMPDIDRIIAEKVKNHFYEIGSFLVRKFGNIGE